MGTIITYQLVHPKYLLSLGTQLDGVDGRFPPFLIPSHGSIEGAADDLVAKTDPHHANAGMSEGLSCELDEFQYPGI
jgi:hypothetical protein